MQNTIDVEPANFIWIDLFPADVSSAESQLEEVRVIVTDNYFYVLDDTVEGPEAIIKEPLQDFDGNNKQGYTVVTTNGEYHFHRSPKCGCGSRVRSVQPFPSTPFVARNLRK